IVRVQQITVRVLERHARRMGLKLPERYRQYVKYSSILHDIGKSGIPEGILYKPGALNEYERMIIEHHPRIGADILHKVTLELKDELFLEGYEVARNIILHHHERWDGSGYPSGLRGHSIPLEARIVAV